MANNLFKKEDFIKNRKQSKPWYGHFRKLWPIGVLIIGGLSAFLILRNNDNLPEEPIVPTNQVESNSDTIQQPQPTNETIATDTLSKADVDQLPSIEVSHSNETESNIKDATQANVVVEKNAHAAALSVIRGAYGNNPIRRKKLGNRYQEIQDIVNQLYREGKVQ